MGGGQEQKNSNGMLQKQGNFAYEQEQKNASRNSADIAKTSAQGDDLYGKLSSGYSSLLDSPYQRGGGGGGPAVDADPRFGQVQSMYTNAMGATGGLDPTRMAEVDATAKKIGGLGYDPDTVNKMGGSGVYDEFAKTGGLSEADRSNLRARATSTIPSMFGRLKDEGNRVAMVQGGYGPGREALQARLARGQAGATSDAARNAETDIVDRVNAGRQWGATSAAGGAQNLASLRSSTLGTEASTNKGIMDAIRSGQQWGTAGTESRAESDRSYQAQQAAAAASAANANAMFAYQQKLEGLGGLNSLYNSGGYGAYNTAQDYGLHNTSVSGGSVNDSASAQKANNRHWYDTLPSIAGGAAAAFA